MKEVRHDSHESGNDSDEEAREDESASLMREVTKCDEGPACQACRRKKAKCSRGQPCSHCVRYNLECTYDDKAKAKPGMRTGAIEKLNQRVVALENMFLGQGLLWQQVWRCLDGLNQQAASSPSGTHGQPTSDSLQETTARLKMTLSALHPDAQDDQPSGESPGLLPSAKRRRINPIVEPVQTQSPTVIFSGNGSSPQVPDDLVDSLVEVFSARVQPWIPILHLRRFRQRMKVPQQRPKLRTIFFAIVSLCARFSDDPRLADPQECARLARECRQAVILESVESFSVENLQALIICAFDTIGSGRGPSAWSIVGSMARTVEHLQLNVEDEDTQQPTKDFKVLITRMAFLPPCQDWIEVEERRRVFWNVFLMDCFCSIATGWNLSLKGAEIKRRLPCEGALWDAGHPLPTPTVYFGVSHHISSEPMSAPSCSSVDAGPDAVANLGGFAYCIEATENLSQVTSFFLRQAVDVTDVHSIQRWLVRFKQLDLRLVQWKTFLPERWREACALNSDGNMDSNLTLAHITHNTAVVLLHQGIAYPSAEWQVSPIRLPSASSAETCLAAGREVSIIAERFLQGADSITNPQFSFCHFICGRMFLAHSAYYGTALPKEFDILVSSLEEISRRWTGNPCSQNLSAPRDNLASKFARRLAQARRSGPLLALDIRQAAYSDNNNTQEQQAQQEQEQAYGSVMDDASAGMHSLPHHGQGNPGFLGPLYDEGGDPSPDSISLAFPPLPIAFQAPITAHVTDVSSPARGAIVHEGEQMMSPPLAQPGARGFEELNSFLDYSFLPYQRVVSMFSRQGD